MLKYLVRLAVIMTCALSLLPLSVLAENSGSGWVSLQTTASQHSKHQAMLKKTAYQRSLHTYATPDVTLISKEGKDIRLRDILDSDEPILMQFIFTTCSTICPVLSATLANVQETLLTDGRDTHFVSISVDPEYDTPKTLNKYSKKFNANKNWTFLTGQKSTVAQVQKAFDAYYAGNNKMYHQPYTYLRANKGSQWIRISGLLSSKELISEYNKLFDTALLTK